MTFMDKKEKKKSTRSDACKFVCLIPSHFPYLHVSCAVPLYEVGFCEHQAGFQHGCSNVKRSRFIIYSLNKVNGCIYIYIYIFSSICFPTFLNWDFAGFSGFRYFNKTTLCHNIQYSH